MCDSVIITHLFEADFNLKIFIYLFTFPFINLFPLQRIEHQIRFGMKRVIKKKTRFLPFGNKSLEPIQIKTSLKSNILFAVVFTLYMKLCIIFDTPLTTRMLFGYPMSVPVISPTA